MSYPNADPAQYPSGPTDTAPKPALSLDRRGQAYAGGLIAGMAIAVGLAVVIHVMAKLSPNSAANCGVGCGYGIGGSVLLVLFLGLIVGLGLGMGMAAAVPERTADSASADRATLTDRPPAPSA